MMALIEPRLEHRRVPNPWRLLARLVVVGMIRLPSADSADPGHAAVRTVAGFR